MSTESQRIIEAVAPQLGGGRIQHDSQGVWEWRGRPSEHDTRVRAERYSCQVQVEVRNPLGSFELKWSPKYVPDPAAVDDDAFDVTDEVRVWVGRNVIIECFGLEMEQQIAGFRSLPPQGAGYLIEGMQRDHVSVLGVGKDQLLGFVPLDNPDAVGAIVRFTTLLAWTAAQLEQMAPTAQPQLAAAREPRMAARLRCNYCRALFLLTPTSQCRSAARRRAEARPRRQRLPIAKEQIRARRARLGGWRRNALRPWRRASQRRASRQRSSQRRASRRLRPSRAASIRRPSRPARRATPRADASPSSSGASEPDRPGADS